MIVQSELAYQYDMRIFLLGFPVPVHTHKICDSPENPWNFVNICFRLYIGEDKKSS